MTLPAGPKSFINTIYGYCDTNICLQWHFCSTSVVCYDAHGSPTSWKFQLLTSNQLPSGRGNPRMLFRGTGSWQAKYAVNMQYWSLSCALRSTVERPQFDFCVLNVVDTSARRKDSWLHLWWNIMILIFFIIFGARSLTRVILAFGEHNHESGNWLQKWWKRSKSLCAPWGLEPQPPWWQARVLPLSHAWPYCYAT